MKFSAGIYSNTYFPATLQKAVSQRNCAVARRMLCMKSTLLRHTSLVKTILFRKNNFICYGEVSRFIINRCFWFFDTKQLNSFCNHMSRNKCEVIVFHFFRRTKEFNFKVMLKVPNFVFKFLGKKILEFCKASKSYTSAFYDKILSTVIKCLCG